MDWKYKEKLSHVQLWVTLPVVSSSLMMWTKVSGLNRYSTQTSLDITVQVITLTPPIKLSSAETAKIGGKFDITFFL